MDRHRGWLDAQQKEDAVRARQAEKPDEDQDALISEVALFARDCGRAQGPIKGIAGTSLPIVLDDVDGPEQIIASRTAQQSTL